VPGIRRSSKAALTSFEESTSTGPSAALRSLSFVSRCPQSLFQQLQCFPRLLLVRRTTIVSFLEVQFLAFVIELHR
jgi:hypothetical protein